IRLFRWFAMHPPLFREHRRTSGVSGRSLPVLWRPPGDGSAVRGVSSLRLVEAVEELPLVEKPLVRVVPALRDRGDREELDVGELLRVALPDRGIDRAVEVLRDDR